MKPARKAGAYAATIMATSSNAHPTSRRGQAETAGVGWARPAVERLAAAFERGDGEDAPRGMAAYKPCARANVERDANSTALRVGRRRRSKRGSAVLDRRESPRRTPPPRRVRRLSG